MLPFLPTAVPFGVNLLVAARLLPFFVRKASLAEVIALATPAPDLRGSTPMDASTVVAAVKRATRRPWLMRNRRCLREGMLAFHYLSLAGHAPVLHFAVIASSMKTARPSAHCWIALDGETVLNPPAEPMVELFRHDGSSAGPNAFASRRMEWS